MAHFGHDAILHRIHEEVDGFEDAEEQEIEVIVKGGVAHIEAEADGHAVWVADETVTAVPVPKFLLDHIDYVPTADEVGLYVESVETAPPHHGMMKIELMLDGDDLHQVIQSGEGDPQAHVRRFKLDGKNAMFFGYSEDEGIDANGALHEIKLGEDGENVIILRREGENAEIRIDMEVETVEEDRQF